jgi:diguanylate cyclase (GGDEF)-like protein
LQQLAEHLNVALEHADLAEKLKELTRRDVSLPLANRRYCQEKLDEEWQRLRREKAFLSIIFLDIDYFGFYNKRYGHPTGDDCLLQFVKAVQSVLKRSTDFFARYGGEEFMIILPNTEQEGAITIAKQIQEAILNLKIPHENRPDDQPFVIVSMGIGTQIPDVNHSQADLIAKVDKALLLAKESGRNCWKIFSNSEKL